jgi:hypothetical protein
LFSRTTEICIGYEIDRYLRAFHAAKRLSIIVHITSKKVNLTFLSQMLCVYETFRSFVWCTPPLFGGFVGTIRLSDFPCSCIIGFVLRLPNAARRAIADG